MEVFHVLKFLYFGQPEAVVTSGVAVDFVRKTNSSFVGR